MRFSVDRHVLGRGPLCVLYASSVDERSAPSPVSRSELSGPVPLAIVSAATSAHMIKCVLDDAGIHAVVVGEHSASTLPLMGAIVPVTVLVPRGDYDRAAAALDEAVLGAGAPMRCSACGYDLGGLEQQERCPECGAKYIDLRRRITLAPRPGAAGETGMAVRMGAIVGMLVVVGVVGVLVAFVIWGVV